MVIKDDPGLYRRRVRNSLRQARSRAGRTQQDVAEALDWSLSKVIRVENGTAVPSTTDLKALLGFLQVTEPAVVAALVNDARASRRKPWWYDYRELIRPQFAQLLSYEAGASSARAYSPTLITALLQTLDYARALRTATVQDPEVRNRLVDLLAERQKLVADDDTFEARFIVDEAALRRCVGGASIMGDQLDRILERMHQPRTHVRVLPLAVGAHPSLNGPFVMLRLAEGGDDVVFLEGTKGDTISHEDEEESAWYGKVYERLESLSLSAEDSETMIRTVRKQYREMEKHGA